MKRIDTEPKKKLLFGFDVETATVDGKQVFVCCAIVCHSLNIKKIFWNQDHTVEYMKRLRRIHNGIYFVATKLTFDIFELLKGSKHLQDCHVMFRKSRLLNASLPSKKNGWGPLGQQKFHQMVCIDSLNHFPSSVANMGKLIGIEKSPHPKCFTRFPETQEEALELQEYCIQDARITSAFMEMMQDVYNEEGGELRPTIASTALNIFKRTYLKENLPQERKEVDDFIRSAYFGGRTETFKRGFCFSTEKRKIQCFDLNSAYVYFMTKELPKPGSEKMVTTPSKLCIEIYRGISECTVTVPKMFAAPLPWKNEEGRLCFPTGTFRGQWCHKELRMAMEHGVVIEKIHKQLIYTQTWFPTKEYSETMYKKRLEMKAKKDTREVVYKSLGNNLYGRFGMNPHDQVDYIHKSELDSELQEAYDKRGFDMRLIHEQSDYVTFCKDECEEIPMDVHTILSVCIAAECRMLLYSYMQQAGDSLIYTDTDSITSEIELPTTKELGGMSLEKNITYGWYVRPKVYAFVDATGEETKSVVKCKGVPGLYGRSRVERWFHLQRFKDAVRDGKPFRYSSLASWGLTHRPFQGSHKEIHEQLQHTKYIDLEDTKRVWPDTFDPYGWQISKPIHIRKV